MKINFIKKTLLLFALSLAIVSCSHDDQIGDSELVPMDPNVTITLDFSSPITLTENDQVFEYVVTLSNIQIVDTRLHVSQIGGDADGDDYEMTTLVVIPAGYLTGSGSIKILHDEIIEDTETLNIQIGDERTANSTMTPATADFSILNVTSADLVMNLSWAASEFTTDSSGEEIDPTDLADLRLLITDADGNILDGADGGSFETYVFSGDNPDGEYFVITDFYAAIDSPLRDLNLDLSFDQTGTIENDAYSYENALNTAFVCANNFYTMVKLTKAGGDYTIENVASNNFESQAISWSVGTDVIDAFSGPDGYASQITTNVDCVGNSILGLNANWMVDAWGEEVIAEAPVYFTVDAAGVVTIESQYIFTTLYSGDEYDYTVSGSGTYDAANGTLVINYYMDQDGFSPNGWMFDNGYMDQDYFIANVSVE